MKKSKIPFWLGFGASAFLTYRNGEEWLGNAFLALSESKAARNVITGWGPSRAVSQRFVAGEQIADAINAARQLNSAGMLVSMDYLGESVATRYEAEQATKHIVQLLDDIATTNVNANVSVKPSQLGANIDADFAYEQISIIVDRARQHGNWVRLDMEDTSLTDATIALHDRLRDDARTNVGIVVQSYLHRTEADIKQLVEQGARVRLCKGAYAEPPSIAFEHKRETDANFVRLMQRLLSDDARAAGVYAGIATHDDNMINATLAYVREHNIRPDEFEFQMLYGVRRQLQNDLRDQGFQVRVYVPYGTAWYPYLMRRLAERPANAWFFASNFFKE